ncbi:2-keto-4-pentenoate hydratase [Vibrio sp. UCD-FRSSP16_10]|uniref:fumarylacetoacetate hydrolase family protein n=1 Tax=unclassified Vibrio TaxID=2614977 RepID=UPI0007FCCB0E|nr:MULTISPECIES: fumarylacetoacetate hydrolase family protein [unclassified Vibrio]OBT15546.1 2-keto-4-pentenoate hydratase [Vibrio sp. UCD-FRSSP16_30]OBT20619.1 2-keto-4-pentenoate hydratase [Vibrio sp. UCD-FRSSP16_10]
MPLNTIELNSTSRKNCTYTPSKIVCIGRNYVAHIEELGNEIPEDMVVFMKPNSSLTSTLHSVHGEALHYEAELCFLVESGEFSAVAIGLDLTKREMQKQLKNKGLPWERCKAFDGSALLSDFVELNNGMQGLSLQLWINDVLIQQGGIELMLYPPKVIKQQLAQFMTLEDGDVVMTGTPKGVGIVNKGDRFVGRVLQGEQCLIEQRWIAQ